MAKKAEQDFPDSARLKTPAAFKRVFSHPDVSADGCFKVLARRNDLDASRLGMAVSKQVDRCSPGRNRIKRVIRESFRRYSGHRSDQENLNRDYVVLPRRNAASICNSELTRSLNKHWRRIDHKLKSALDAGFPSNSGPERQKTRDLE